MIQGLKTGRVLSKKDASVQMKMNTENPHGPAEPSALSSFGTQWGMRSIGTYLLLDIFILSKVFSLSYNLFIVV